MAGVQSSTFSALVHQVLVVEKKYAVREVAVCLGLSYAAFHSRLSGRGSFSPEELNRLLRVVPDPRLADWLLANTPFFAAGRPETVDLELSKSALSHATHTAELGLSVMKELTEAMTESSIDEERRARLERHLREMQRSIATLGAALPYLCSNPKQLPQRLVAI